ncbi:MAG: hypothetical protein ACPG8W_02850 [Candidatus Promineifilaceae bacterium]
MMRFLAFLVKNDVWILFLCVLGVVWYIFQLLSSRRSLQRSSFRMERERAGNDRNTAVFSLLVFVGIIAMVTYVNTNLASTIPREFLEPPTITPDLIATQLATPTVVITPRSALPTATPVLAPTATLRDGTLNIVQQTGPTRPAPLQVEPLIEGCGSVARIHSPKSGQTLIGGISIFGQADGESFNFYQLEILGPQTSDTWQSLIPGVVAEPVSDGFLASADFAGWDTGIYQVRLSVFSAENETLGSCLIQVGINP